MKRTTFLLMILICYLSSCNSQKNAVKNTETISIADKEWVAVLLKGNSIELDKEQLPTLKLSEGKVSGYASCNRYHGTYTLNGDKLSFSPLARTKMLCEEVQNNTENNYLEALSAVKSWEYKQNQLYFLNEDKQTLIIFEEKK